jgi:hypothetical protein
MRTTWTTRITWVIAGILVAGSLAAMDINKLPPDNWRAPTGVHTMTDATSPRAFIGLPPCRIVDTRGTAGIPINTGGAFAANEARTWTFTGLCGIPAGADAVSLNITVTDTGGQTAFGFVKVWPGGGTEPNVSTLNWSTGGVTESNAAIVPFGTGGNAGMIRLRSGNNSSNVIVDTNGYFSSTLGTPSNFFTLENNSTNYTMFLHNANGSCTNQCGLWTIVDHGSAIWGESATGGDGVYGVSDDASGAGVHGVLTPNLSDSKAVWGEHKSTGTEGIGVYGSHAGTGIGVQGLSSGTTGIGAIGVLGQAFSNSDDTVGVEGNELAPSGSNLRCPAKAAARDAVAVPIRP